MFIDEADVFVRAGKGGKGCRSFYQDKFMRNGIPDGGNGGKGADIILKSDRNLYTLLDFRYNRHFFGLHGKHGSGKNKKGKDAQAIIIPVPCGTVIKDVKTGSILSDLEKDGQQVIVAKGGNGGCGNTGNREVTEGGAGEERQIHLDLKVIADAGIVGFPNAGKSTLISHISNAHPKIAAYPFTTKVPALGVVRQANKQFIIADIPGLIEGSSRGRGLGGRFLRHIERTRVIVHLIDMSGSEGRDPLEDFKIINKELREYSPEVHKKPQLIAANKMDLDNAHPNLERFKKIVKKKVYAISALEKQGLEELIEGISKRL